MKKIEHFLTTLQSALVNAVVFLFPVFFLPITRDFVILSKFYFLIYAVIALMLVTFVSLIVTRKIHWHSNIFTHALLLVLMAMALSILLMSPNKIAALFNPHFGFISMASFIILYFVITGTFKAKSNTSLLYSLMFAGFISALFALILTIEPFKTAKLPYNLAFLKNPYFNSIGSQIESIIFQLFVFIIAIIQILKMRENKNAEAHKDSQILFLAFALFILVSIGLQSYQITKSIMAGSKLILPPLSVSWYAAIEVLKNPLTALFGVGVDNYVAIFTKAKDVQYNMSELWQITSFQSSRSTLLHIISETGLLGLVAFGLLVGRIFQYMKENHNLESNIYIIFSLAALVLLPPSFITFFIFFISLAFFAIDAQQKHNKDSYEIDFGQILPLYVGSLIILGLILASVTFFVTKVFVSEVLFAKAAEAASMNNLKDLYEYQRKAIINNPYNKDYRISFSQTNMLLANNIASKKKEEITDTDRQTIAQAIQASISEAKAAVALNPFDVNSWQYLAQVYSSITGVAQGAEGWTISAYQQAMKVDPQNPLYRLQLGGMYYLYKNYEAAQKNFEEAISLKPDWPNAYYNLAWTYFQKKDYKLAVDAMQATINLIDPKKAEADYKKAQKDLEDFKKMLPTDNGQQGTQQNEKKPENLNLPSPPPATMEPKISLPPAASPSGRP